MRRRFLTIALIVIAVMTALCLFACDSKQPHEYSITYLLDDGVAENLTKYTENTETFTLNNPTKEGYDFIGWTWDGQTDPQLVVTIEKGSTGDKTFTANYIASSSDQPLEYSITYLLDDGVAENLTKYTENTETFTLNNPTKEGYDFIGWTWDGQTDPQLVVTIEKGSVGDKTFTANYLAWEFSPLKIAVFADVQLTTNNNRSSTSNSYLALRNHLQYAKSINADVLFMAGDIVNNAVTAYYDYFMSVVKEVYGADEGAYPEFVMNMGNHEWWGSNSKPSSEEELGGAVALFNQYARIDTESLVKRSAVPYSRDNSTTLPSYYKVIKGVPFLVVSADNSSGAIGNELKNEIAGWLREISQLESVKRGGPIFVSYHYPIYGVTYKGEHTETVTKTIDDLLRNYPSAIVFTGDTHYNAINERTIHQQNYTSINIGTSSYSRSISESATGFAYDNVNYGSGKSAAGTMLGDINFKYEYTPTMMVVSMDTADVTKIDRYFTADDVKDVKCVGTTWEIPLIKNKESFVYTNDRIQNTAWAERTYGKTGLAWSSDKSVRYKVDGKNMLVVFDDVIDYNSAEHYRIEVKDVNNAQNLKYYDYMSHYYKFDATPHSYHIVLEDIPVATNYVVTVTAYDFFDNPSTNVLTATNGNDSIQYPDEIDVGFVSSYSDISRGMNYDVTARGSNSSVEYYYKGTMDFVNGMILGRIIDSDGAVSVRDLLSVKDWANATLVYKIKNVNDFPIDMRLVFVIKEGKNDKWITDGGSEYSVIIPANSDWVQVAFDLSKTFNITSDVVSKLQLKAFVAKSVMDTKNGYELNFYLDNLDVVEDYGTFYRFDNDDFTAKTGTPSVSNSGENLNLTVSTGDVAAFSAQSVKFDDNECWLDLRMTTDVQSFSVSGYDKDGNHKKTINVDLSTDGSKYMVTTVEDTKIVQIKLDDLIDGSVGNSFVIELSNFDQSGNMLISKFVLGHFEDVRTRGKAFTSAGYNTKIVASGDVSRISFDYRIDNNGKMRVQFLDQTWGNGFGPFIFLKDGTTESNYAGVTTQQLGDGYTRVTIDLTASGIIVKGNKTFNISILDIWQTSPAAVGYVDNIVAE